jgi:hypothetical protein
MTEDTVEQTTVTAVALLIQQAFPELSSRAFAVAEATLTKENMPILPIAFVALIGLRSINQSNNVTTPLDLEEIICVEFWLKSQNYARADGSASPFYAYQDYKKTMDKLFNALTGYFTPQSKPVRFISMDTMADEYCLTISFKFSVVWRWCADPDDNFKTVKMSFSVDPASVPKEVGGSEYVAPNSCNQGPAFPPNAGPVPPPNPKN